MNMKKIFSCILTAILICTLVVSCAKEPSKGTYNQEQPKMMIITAMTERGTDVKTTLDGNDEEGYDVLWSEGDEIVFYNRDWTLGEPEKVYKLIDGAGTACGKFEGPELNGGDYVVDYGRTPDHVIAIPQEQIYHPGQARPTGLMRAYITVEDGNVPNIQFKNTTALIRLELKGTGTVKEIMIDTEDSKCISGNGEVDENDFVFRTHFSNRIIVSSPIGIPLTSEGTPVYVVIPQNDYSYFHLHFTDFDGNDCSRKVKDGIIVSTVRSQITPMTVSVSGLNTRLTWDSPAFTRGYIEGREAVVVDFGGTVGKLAVATRNLGAVHETAIKYNYGDFVFWQQAIGEQNAGAWGEGWRMMTTEEVDAFKQVENRPENNNIVIGESLYLPVAGCYLEPDNYSAEYVFGYSWGCEITIYYDDYHKENEVWIQDLMYDNTGVFVICQDALDEKLNVRPVRKLPLTRNTPVGKVGYIEGKEAMVVELEIDGKAKKMLVATRNEGATSNNSFYRDETTSYVDCFGSYLSHTDAAHAGVGGWRLPSKAEMEALVNLPHEWVKDGIASPEKFGDPTSSRCNAAYEITVGEGSKLLLPAAGRGDEQSFVGGILCYWTASPEAAATRTESDGGAATKFQSLYFYGNNPQFLPLEATAPLSTRLVMDFPDYL